MAGLKSTAASALLLGMAPRHQHDPAVRSLCALWLDYGGVFAVANVRGGGEYGEPWHVAGMLTRKQNVFDDFAAAMRLLVERKYTTPDRLAITGRSNGGLTMGAALTQQPQAMRAVVSGVGIYDALRWETQPNGEFNTTEFGSVKDPGSSSPHEYRPCCACAMALLPAVLVTTAPRLPRAPHESRKMARACKVRLAQPYTLAHGSRRRPWMARRLPPHREKPTIRVSRRSLGITAPVSESHRALK